VQNENRLFALRAALHELSRSLEADPFTEDEVQQTKGFLDGYLLLFDQTDARKLGYALDGDFLREPDFLQKWRAAVREVSAAGVNAAWKKWSSGCPRMRAARPGMDEVKRALLSDAETPMRYQKDAQGNVPEKPAALLEADRAVNRTSFGARGDQDVVIVRSTRCSSNSGGPNSARWSSVGHAGLSDRAALARLLLLLLLLRHGQPVISWTCSSATWRRSVTSGRAAAPARRTCQLRPFVVQVGFHLIELGEASARTAPALRGPRRGRLLRARRQEHRHPNPSTRRPMAPSTPGRVGSGRRRGKMCGKNCSGTRDRLSTALPALITTLNSMFRAL